MAILEMLGEALMERIMLNDEGQGRDGAVRAAHAIMKNMEACGNTTDVLIARETLSKLELATEYDYSSMRERALASSKRIIAI